MIKFQLVTTAHADPNGDLLQNVNGILFWRGRAIFTIFPSGSGGVGTFAPNEAVVTDGSGNPTTEPKETAFNKPFGTTAGTVMEGNAMNNKVDKVPSATEDDFVFWNAFGGIQDNGVSMSTDGTLAANSDSIISSQKAVKTYVDTSIAAAAVPDATETVKGKAEIATQAETNTGTDDTRIVTPLKLKNSTQWATKENSITAGTTSQWWRGDKTWQALPAASVIVAGVAEVATQIEVDTGTDPQRIVCPLMLKTNLSVVVPTYIASVAFDGELIGSLGSPDQIRVRDDMVTDLMLMGG